MVSFWYRDKKLRRRIDLQCSPEEFIDRWSQHIPERYRHAVRHFGLFGPRAVRHAFDGVFALLGQKRSPRPKLRPWAESIKRDFGRDPLLDSKGKRMVWVSRIAPGHPTRRNVLVACARETLNFLCIKCSTTFQLSPQL